MNEILKKKLSSIRIWAVAYLLIATGIVVLLVAQNGMFLQKLCVVAFHTDEINAFKAYIDSGGIFEDYIPLGRILAEYAILRNTLICLVIISGLIWIANISSIHGIKKLVTGKKEYNHTSAFGVGSIFFSFILFIVLIISAFFFAKQDGVKLHHLIGYIPVMIVYFMLAIRTFTGDIIEEKSMEVDMKKAAPDLFKDYEGEYIITFRWFVPLGGNEFEWKEKAKKKKLAEIRDKRERERKEAEELENNSKEFGAV